MKSISASIIVLAGAILVASGAHVHHSDTQVVVNLIGAALGLIGLGAWIVSLIQKQA